MALTQAWYRTAYHMHGTYSLVPCLAFATGEIEDVDFACEDIELQCTPCQPPMQPVHAP